MVLKVIILVTIVLFTLLIDLPGLLKIKGKKKRKALIIYFLLLLGGFSLGLLLIINWNPAGPLGLIPRIFQ